MQERPNPLKAAITAGRPCIGLLALASDASIAFAR